MRNLLLGAQIASGILMTVLVLLQQKGVGLGSAFGGEGTFYRARRGAEKVIFTLTIVFAVLFVVTSFVIGEFL